MSILYDSIGIQLYVMQQQSIIKSTSGQPCPQAAMANEQQPQGLYFCYTYIKQMPQAIVSMLLFVLGMAIMWVAYRQYKRAQRYRMINRTITWIYVTIFLWGVLYQFKTVLAQAIFWAQHAKPQPTPSDYLFYSVLSKYNFVIAYLTVFLAQNTVLLVAYNWAANIVGIFEQQGSNKIRSQGRLNVSKHKHFKNEYYCTKILKPYLVIRLVLSVILIIVFLAVKVETIQTKVVMIMLLVIQIQSFLVVVLLTMGVISIKRNKKLSQIIQESEINIMIRQYIILITCSALRFLIDTVFFYLTSWSLSKSTCYIDIDSQFSFLSTLIFVMKALLAHYLTIFLVLKIYYVEEVDQVGIVSFTTELENDWRSSSSYKAIH